MTNRPEICWTQCGVIAGLGRPEDAGSKSGFGTEDKHPCLSQG